MLGNQVIHVCRPEDLGILSIDQPEDLRVLHICQTEDLQNPECFSARGLVNLNNNNINLDLIH